MEAPSSPLSFSATDLTDAIARARLSAVEAAAASLARVEADRSGNAFITLCPERALCRASSELTGPLAGVPFAVKDLLDTAGVRTTYGSAIFADHVPRRTARAVRHLEAAGAVMVGKTNLHEFAWGVTSQNPHWGTVANPTRPGRVAGGSSGGSAAAVADYQVPIALGTDTGGSIRIPAACCRVVGYKPAYGSVSRSGIFPLSPSLDTVGPIARTVADVALVAGVLTGRPSPAPRLDGLRIGILRETGAESDLEALGAHLSDVILPEPLADLMAVFLAEAAISHLPWFPEQRDRYGADLQIKLDGAQKVSAVDYRRGLLALRQLRRLALLKPDVDLIASPVLDIPVPADDCWEPDVRSALTRYTRPFNFLGWPAIAIGNLQLSGRDADVVLGAALAWELAGGQPLPCA
ncbi:MAG: amidase [Candidatus Limnocylindrales bacterium]